MKPTLLLAETTTLDGDHLGLYSHDGTYFLKVNGVQLVTSFAHASEEALARLGCGPVRGAAQPRILIGGLGLGYTVAEACRVLPQKGARFLVTETVPAVADWNRTHLRHLHEGLWEDPRVQIHEGDVGTLLRNSPGGFHVILLGMDHGAEAFTATAKDALYTMEGLQLIAGALKEGGLLTVWSASADQKFEKRLRQAGFEVSMVEVPAAQRGKQKRRHTIWVARNGSYQSQRPSRPI